MNGLTNQIKEDIKRYLETNQNKHRTTQNLWDTTKAVPSRKFIALQAHFRKQGKNWNKQSNFSFKRSRKNKVLLRYWFIKDFIFWHMAEFGKIIWNLKKFQIYGQFDILQKGNFDFFVILLDFISEQSLM